MANFKVGTNTWSRHETAGGIVYWTNSDDEGWGYLNDPDDPDAVRARYPLTYIEYLNNSAVVEQGNGPDIYRQPTAQQTREMTAAALEGVIPLVYGKGRHGGNVAGWKAQASTVRVALGLGHGPVVGNFGLRLFDREQSLISAGGDLWRTSLFGTYFYIRFRNGEASPAAVDSYYSWITGGSEIFPYLAFASYHATFGDNGRLTDFPEPILTYYGRTLRDPRLGQDAEGIPNQPESSSTAVATNPALVLADYYTSPIYGMGVPDTGIDWDSVAEVADYCDEVIHSDKVCDVTMPPTLGNYLGSAGPLTVVFSAPPSGVTAEGEAIINRTTGEIIDVAITNQGSGYVTAPSWYVSVPGNPSHSGTGLGVLGSRRHTVNWAITTKRTHRAITDTIRRQARIMVFRRDGKRVFAAEKATTRTYTFTPDNSTPIGLERISASAMPNMLRVAFVNPKKNYEYDYVWARTAAAEAGTEPPSIEEITLEACNNAAEAQRQADFLLAEMRNPLRVTWLANRGTALAVEVGDRVGYYSPTAGLGNSEADPEDLRVLSVAKRPDGTIRFLGKLYNENAFSDSTRPTEAETATPLPHPTDTPDAPTSPAGASSLTEGDGLIEIFGGGIQISWAHPGWPFQLRYRVTAQPDGGAETVVAEVASGPVTFYGQPLVEQTVRVYAVVASTLIASTACSGTITPTTPTNTYVPRMPIFYSASYPAVKWSKPDAATRDLWGASSWSAGGGATGMNASRINNGEFSLVAVTLPSGAYVDFDAGVAVSLSEFRVRLSPVVESSGPFTVSFSDDGVSYSSVTTASMSLYQRWADTDGYFETATASREDLYLQWQTAAGAVASHRYWRLTNGSGSSLDVIEIQPAVRTAATFPRIGGYRLYNVTNGSDERTLIATLPASYNPSAPYNLTSVADGQAYGTEYWEQGAKVEIRTIDLNGVESDGIVASSGVLTNSVKRAVPRMATYSTAGGYPAIVWRKPDYASRTFSGSWTGGGGATGLTEAAVDDGGLVADAVVLPANAYVDVDLFVELTVNEFRIHLDPIADSYTQPFEVFYSDDGVSYTSLGSVSGSGIVNRWGETGGVDLPAVLTGDLFVHWDGDVVGAHRYWRVKNVSGITLTVQEIRGARPSYATFLRLGGYRLYDVSGGTTARKFWMALSATYDPTIPLDVRPIAREWYSGGYKVGAKVEIRTIDTEGNESDPVVAWVEMSRVATAGTNIANAVVDTTSSQHIANKTTDTPATATNDDTLATTAFVRAAITTYGGSGTVPLTTKGDIYIHDNSAPTRLPVGTDGQVLTADSAETAGLKWADPAGGGATAGTWASRPTSPTTPGAVYFPTDSPYRIVDTGSALKYFLPTAKNPYVVLPPDIGSAWTAVNQDSATVTYARGFLRLYTPGLADAGPHGWVTTAPSTPYTITMAISLEIPLIVQGSVCFLLRESSTNKVMTLNAYVGTSGLYYGASTFTADGATWVASRPTTSSSGPYSHARNDVTYLRYSNDGTTRKALYSLDGYNFTEYLSESALLHTTVGVDQVGIGITQDATGSYAYANVYSWIVE